ncbi:hypothetical protein EAO71_05195 [Streptomyces sp. ms191]|uniref:hypothetical protein n=1 Tax=unclassified Streptomyces TaxID=2593676 RepID=UPI0011CE0141|nr:hypothetical protein [Streptomyces sp. ms191]TXS32247.1 hypothetical protein EAO71_05195 [Streptomyces sp. ms191]
MADRDFPHLGWDPAPGSPPEIAALRAKLSASAGSLGTAHRLVDRLLSESAGWRGEAADAFRDALAGDLPRHLGNAHRSLTKAAGRLGAWHDALVGYQSTARSYETRAGLDAEAVRRSEAAWRTASAPGADTPEPELRRASADLTKARQALDHVRRKARELEETHRTQAGAIAKSLNEATDKLAPREPGWLDKGLDWLDENLGDTLSLTSALLGLVAVFATGGLVVPLLFAAAGLSLAALALHAGDPKIRTALKGGFTEGRFDSRFFSATATLAGDAVGAVPGLGAVAQGAKGARAATGFGEGVRTFGRSSTTALREFDAAPRPVTEWAVRRVGPGARTPVNAAFAGTGTLTAASGVAAPDDDRLARDGATGVDAARLGSSEIPAYWTHARDMGRAAGTVR